MIGKVASALSLKNSEANEKGLIAIQAALGQELKQPNLLEPLPQMNPAKLNPAEKDFLVEQGILIEKDKKYFQPTLLTKIGAVETLAQIHSQESKKYLEEVVENQDSPAELKIRALLALETFKPVPYEEN